MRHRPTCKKCGSIKSVKNGHNSCGTQRYKCKECNAVFVWRYEKDRLPKHKLKREILAAYTEGMGIRAICRTFKVSYRSLSLWIKAEGKKI